MVNAQDTTFLQAALFVVKHCSTPQSLEAICRHIQAEHASGVQSVEDIDAIAAAAQEKMTEFNFVDQMTIRIGLSDDLATLERNGDTIKRELKAENITKDQAATLRQVYRKRLNEIKSSFRD